MEPNSTVPAQNESDRLVKLTMFQLLGSDMLPNALPSSPSIRGSFVPAEWDDIPDKTSFIARSAR